MCVERDTGYAESQGVFTQPRPTVSPQAHDAHVPWSALDDVGLLPSSVSPAVETTLGLDYWQSVPGVTQQLDFTVGTPNVQTQLPNIPGSMLSSATPSLDW